MPKEQVMLGVDGTLADLQREGQVYQPKWDGNRGKLVYTTGAVKVINRRGGDWARSLPDLVEETQRLAETTGAKSFTIDGEVVVFDNGHTNLHMSNTRCSTEDRQRIRLILRRTMPVHFMAFDLLEWNGTGLEEQPFHYRCSELLKLLGSQKS